MKILKLLIGKLTSRIVNKGNNKISFSSPKVYKHTIKIKGEDNIFECGNDFKCKNIKVDILGNKNKVIIKDNFEGRNLLIKVTGDNNLITIGNNIRVTEGLTIYSHEAGHNRTIEIRDNTSFFKSALYNYDNGSKILIGEDCMFAYNTVLYNTDSHAIFQNGKLINQAETMKIGNHVWICENANILKNSIVSECSIVARNALVAGCFNDTNVIIGGIPAKVIKTGITWDRKSINEVLKG